MIFAEYLAAIIVNNGPSRFAILHHWNIYREWQAQIKSKKEPLDLELPWLTVLAKNYVEQYLKGKEKQNLKVFEYGSGGSSLFFLKYAEEVVSVEHNQAWFNKLSDRIKTKETKAWKGHLIKPEVLDDSLLYTLDPAKPLDYFSSNTDYSNATFKAYASFIDSFPDQSFDLVLIDGRSRPSCIYHSMRKVKKGGLLVLDNAERKHYLSANLIDAAQFDLVLSSYGALICSNDFTQTNIYLRR
jgi:hypothetical protein